MSQNLPDPPFSEGLLLDYVDGTLEGAEKAEVEAFLKAYPAWEAELGLLTSLSEEVQGLPKVKAPPGFLEGVRERVDAEGFSLLGWLRGIFSLKSGVATGALGTFALVALVMLIVRNPSAENMTLEAEKASAPQGAMAPPSADFELADEAKLPEAGVLGGDRRREDVALDGLSKAKRAQRPEAESAPPPMKSSPPAPAPVQAQTRANSAPRAPAPQKAGKVESLSVGGSTLELGASKGGAVPAEAVVMDFSPEPPQGARQYKDIEVDDRLTAPGSVKKSDSLSGVFFGAGEAVEDDSADGGQEEEVEAVAQPKSQAVESKKRRLAGSIFREKSESAATEEVIAAPSIAEKEAALVSPPPVAQVPAPAEVSGAMEQGGGGGGAFLDSQDVAEDAPQDADDEAGEADRDALASSASASFAPPPWPSETLRLALSTPLSEESLRALILKAGASLRAGPKAGPSGERLYLVDIPPSAYPELVKALEAFGAVEGPAHSGAPSQLMTLSLRAPL